MQTKEFDHKQALSDGSTVNLHVRFEPDRYIVTEPKSGWIAHFAEDNPLIASDRPLVGIDEDDLIQQLTSPVDKGLFHLWMVWRTDLG